MKNANASKTILIVDDEPAIREVLRRLLAPQGYRLLCACDGKQALAAIKKSKPDMVLLDVTMPELDGMAVCRRIREQAQTRLLPVIMITGRGAPLDELAGFEHGADDYIIKPFDAHEVKARVAGLFRRSEAKPDGPPTILVVDDEPAVRKSISRMLSKVAPAWKVKEAAGVSRAKTALLKMRPDLVIVDLRLKDGDGVELCRLITEHPWLARTKVLVLTGQDSRRARRRTFAQGASEFLAKPVDLADLAASVGRLLP